MKREELNYILQKANIKELKKLYKAIKEKYEVKILLAPVQQTLLQPVHDPISEGKFYSGEILVTTTIVSVENHEQKGWSMVLDNNEKTSLYIAVCDGAFGANYFKHEIENLINNTKKEILKEKKSINKKINATKVSFDLMT